MKKNLQRHDEANMTLRRLEQYSTLSPFCRLFYRTIYDRLGAVGLDAEKLDQAFHLFLRCECKKHEAVAGIVRQGKLNLIKTMRIGRTARWSLERLCSAVERMESSGPREAIIRELILTECNYHLGRTDKVIRALKATVQLGCEHPLIHFALGYNIYQSALERFAHAGKRKGEIVATNPRAFESTCRESIAAFERGLDDTLFDAQISWWIGLISEMIGERDAAQEAYTRAMNVDPDNFAVMAGQKLRSLSPSTGLTRSPAEQERLSRLSPITDEDIRQARQLLAGLDSFRPFFLGADDS